MQITELKNILTELKSTLEVSTAAQMKQKKGPAIQNTRQDNPPKQSSKNKKRSKSEDSLWDMWDNIKQNNIHIIEILGEEEKRGQKYLKK